jgi:hypothetical protein
MKDINILNCLKVRSHQVDVSEQVISFENFCHYKLPPLYKTFYKTYYLGEDTFLNREYYLYDSKRKLLVSQSVVVLQKRDSLPELEQIFDLDTIKIVLDNYSNDGTYEIGIDSSLSDKKLLPIMKHDNAMLIAVGYGLENQDEIYLYNTDKSDEEGRFVKLADDIFEYLRGVMVCDDPDTSELYSKLYKKWNEDFWRVKENQGKRIKLLYLLPFLDNLCSSKLYTFFFLGLICRPYLKFCARPFYVKYSNFEEHSHFCFDSHLP